jgi:hypothetical protein
MKFAHRMHVDIHVDIYYLDHTCYLKAPKSLYFEYREMCGGSIFGLLFQLNPLNVPQSINVSLIGS